MNFSIEVEWSLHGNELRSPCYCYSTCFHRLLSMANRPVKRFVVGEKKPAKWRRWNQEMLYEYIKSMSLSAIRKRSNIWTCQLPSHSSTLSDTPIPTRLQTIWQGWSTGSMRVGVYLYTDLMICRHFARLMHQISFTSSQYNSECR